MKTLQTKIEWCDFTFNPWRGCAKVSEGCAHCYAESAAKRNPTLLGKWGLGKPRVLASDDMWASPLKWNMNARLFMECSVCGKREFRKPGPMGLSCCSGPGCVALPETEASQVRPRIFCASFADWLDDEVSPTWLYKLLNLIRCTPQLDWLLLTKRPQNWRTRLVASMSGHASDRADNFIDSWVAGMAPDNVWLGATTENQARADERIPELLKIPAVIRFVSMEPLLGPVRFADVPGFNKIGQAGQDLIRNFWVIAGGESGAGARPMHPDWVRSLRDQCATAGVPFLFKQWGCWMPQSEAQFNPVLAKDRQLKGHRFDDGTLMLRMAKETAGRVLDGRVHNEFPKPRL